MHSNLWATAPIQYGGGVTGNTTSPGAGSQSTTEVLGACAATTGSSAHQVLEIGSEDTGGAATATGGTLRFRASAGPALRFRARECGTGIDTHDTHD